MNSLLAIRLLTAGDIVSPPGALAELRWPASWLPQWDLPTNGARNRIQRLLSLR
jgi:hypothetical protein